MDPAYEPPDDVEGRCVGIQVTGQAVCECGLDVDLDDPAGRHTVREWRGRLNFDADYRCTRRLTGGDSDSADQSAAADRYHDVVNLRPLFEYLQSDRSRPGDDVEMRVRRNI